MCIHKLAPTGSLQWSCLWENLIVHLVWAKQNLCCWRSRFIKNNVHTCNFHQCSLNNLAQCNSLKRTDHFASLIIIDSSGCISSGWKWKHPCRLMLFTLVLGLLCFVRWGFVSSWKGFLEVTWVSGLWRFLLSIVFALRGDVRTGSSSAVTILILRDGCRGTGPCF